MTADAPFERTTRANPKHHPPCDRVCWEQVGIYTWVFTKGHDEACWWDDVAKQWTRCNESEQ